MKIINRIMISSAFLALISLVSLLVVISAIIFLTPDDPGKELLDKDVFQVWEALDKFDASVQDWNTLNARLSNYGYRLFVLEDDHIVFSTLSASDSQGGIINSLKPLNPEQSKLTGKVQDMTFAAVLNGSYSIFAVGGEKENPNYRNDFPQLFVISCLIVIAVILLLSQLFTRKMIWRILRPLNAMSDGAKRIEQGDFSKPIDYKGNDEFSSVCAAFNHMQEFLLKEREKTASYERARTDMIAGISHDLRTPLTSVMGFIMGLREGVASTPEKQEQYLSVAYQKACDMDVLLKKLFFFSRLETGNLPLSFEYLDLGEFSQKFAEEINGELEQKGARLSVAVTSVPHPVKVDAEQMRRVLLNLTENAIHHAGANPLYLNISIKRERNMEYLLFSDNGHGIQEIMLPHLFERFWRGDESRGTKKHDGSGLGLYIVKYIIETHGGSVTAKNDDGLVIEIKIPCGKEDNDEKNTHN